MGDRLGLLKLIGIMFCAIVLCIAGDAIAWLFVFGVHAPKSWMFLQSSMLWVGQGCIILYMLRMSRAWHQGTNSLSILEEGFWVVVVWFFVTVVTWYFLGYNEHYINWIAIKFISIGNASGMMAFCLSWGLFKYLRDRKSLSHDAATLVTTK